MLTRHLENDLSLTPSWREPRTAAPATPTATRSCRHAVAALNTHTLYMLVLYINQYFLLLTDCFLHQKFSSHLATVPLMPRMAGGDPRQDGGSTPTAKPSSCRKEQIHWASSFCKLDHLQTCCLCSCGMFPCVPVYFNLFISFFQINFETNSHQISC